jgi:hypothetical protein
MLTFHARFDKNIIFGQDWNLVGCNALEFGERPTFRWNISPECLRAKGYASYCFHVVLTN